MATVDAAPLRVVVADDSPESRALVRAMLDPVDGVEVVGAAADGRQAVELVGRQHPDLILLDIAMPVMNGADCCRALRGLSPALPILLTSGFPKDHDIQTLLENPHTRYIHKPYDQDDLARALAGIVGGAATGNAHHGS